MDFFEAVMYNDDGLCVRYEDGSVLQLSPCSSVFRYQESQSLSQHLQRPYFQQLTRFVVSSLKCKVVCAVNLRNKYATRTYLCKELLGQELFSVEFNDVSECTWPQTLSSECITQNDNGSITVKSLEGFAILTLNPNKQSFSISYLAKAAQDKCKDLTQCLYTWVHIADQFIQDCPDYWIYPLKMTLEKSQDKLHASQELLALSNVSKLPETLPFTCYAAHLHKWTLRDQVFTGNAKEEEVFWQPNMKIVWKNNITYRVYKNKGEMLKVEIDPGDGTVFTSSGLTGKFFNHFGNTETEGKMYTADKPPPDRPGMKYSMAKILRQGSRLFNFIQHLGLHDYSEQPICWKYKCQINNQGCAPSQAESLHIIETATVPNVGKFVAYSNGHLYITFTDRTMLNVRYEPGFRKEDLWFNCTLPNGQVLQGNVENMLGLERYIKMACQWGDWVSSSPQQRKTFYKDTMWDTDQQRIVEAEVSKLRRFNYILNHGSLNQKLTQAADKPHTSYLIEQENNQNNDMNYPSNQPDVTMALQNTTTAITNIENFLSTSKTST